MENEMREPAVAYGKSKFPIEEYLEFEKTTEEKYDITRVKFSRCRAQKLLAILSQEISMAN